MVRSVRFSMATMLFNDDVFSLLASTTHFSQETCKGLINVGSKVSNLRILLHRLMCTNLSGIELV